MTRFPLVWVTITTGSDPVPSTSDTYNVPQKITVKCVKVACT